MIINKTQKPNKQMQLPPANRGLNCYSLLTIEVNDCAIISCMYKRSLTDLINQGNFKRTSTKVTSK